MDGSLGGGSGPLGKVDNNYQITEDLGKLRGSNLFHSFGQFNLDIGESATFSGPSPVENILSRVTGGNTSRIDGTIRSTYPGANLYLMNPAGIVFGPNASLDVKGSFHATTADYLRLSDGVRFTAAPVAGAVLSSAPPEAFGFLNDNAAAISVDGSMLEVSEDQTLSLVGGDLAVTGGDAGSISAPGGRIDLAAVASPGEVVPNADGEPPDLAVDSFATLASIEISDQANMDAGGDGGGTIVIRGGHFVLEGGSQLFASAKGPADGSAVPEPGAGIDVKATGDIEITDTDTRMGTQALEGVTVASGGVRLQADGVEISNGAQILSQAFGQGSGDSGDVQIDANRVSIHDGGWIWTATGSGGAGDAGGIAIAAEHVEILDGGLVYSNSFESAGNAGDIEIDAHAVVLSNAAAPGELFTGITSQTSGEDSDAGDAGNIRVTTNQLRVMDGTEISTPTFGAGRGGDITINVAGDALLSGVDSNAIFTGIFANTFGAGDAGDLEFSSKNLLLTQQASFQTQTLGAGTGGDMHVTAERLEMSGSSRLESSSIYNPGFGAFGEGQGGNIALDVGSVILTDRAHIAASGGGSGAAGDITVRSRDLELREGAFITTSGAVGIGLADAGDIDLQTDRFLISGFEQAEDPFRTDATGVFAHSWNGDAGNIRIRAQDSVALINRGTVTSSSFHDGEGGNIDIETTRLDVLSGSNILTSAFGTGDGGDIRVTTGELLISGVHPQPLTDVTGTTNLSPSGIGSQAGIQGGSAGGILINTDTLQVLDGGRISTETFGPGSGGPITINADHTRISGISEALRTFLLDAGIESDDASRLASAGIVANSNAFFLGDAATGAGGDIRVKSGVLELTDHGRLATETTGPGPGGSIDVAVSKLTIKGRGASISAESTGTGNAGTLSLTASKRIELLSDASVTTEADIAGGGRIHIAAGDLLYLLGSRITSSVADGSGNGGDISIDPEFVVLDHSRILANAVGGNGGNITIVTDHFVSSADSLVDASSRLGINGDINIQSPDEEISNELVELPATYLDAAGLLRERCSARRFTGRSSFVVSGRRGLPAPPDAGFSLSGLGAGIEPGGSLSPRESAGTRAGRAVLLTGLPAGSLANTLDPWFSGCSW